MSDAKIIDMQTKAITELLISMLAIGYPEPHAVPDWSVCRTIARSAVKRAANSLPKEYRRGLIKQLLQNI